MSFGINSLAHRGIDWWYGVDDQCKSPKIAGQVLTGISGSLLGVTAIVVPVLSSVGIWAPFVASNPAFLAAFASIVAILILALIIGLILLIYVAQIKSNIHSRIDDYLLGWLG